MVKKGSDFQTVKSGLAKIGLELSQTSRAIETAVGYKLYDCAVDPDKVLSLLVHEEEGRVEDLSILIFRGSFKSTREVYHLEAKEVVVSEDQIHIVIDRDP